MSLAQTSPYLNTILTKQREADYVKGELKTVGNQIAALHMQGAYLEEQSIRLETFLTQQFEHIAKAECRALCNVILVVMPRELRDLIYTEILSGSVYLEAVNLASERELALHEQIPALSILLGQHWTQTSYVGAQFHLELINRFYEMSNLYIIDPDPVRGTHLLRQKEPFDGFVMFGQYIRNITFVVRQPESWDSSKNSVLEGLTALEQLAERMCSVVIRLEYEADTLSASVLAAIGLKLGMMKNGGFRVQIQCGKELKARELAVGSCRNSVLAL